MGLFIRLTVLAALAIVALFVLAFLLKALVLGVIVAALIFAVFFVMRLFRRNSTGAGPLVRR